MPFAIGIVLDPHAPSTAWRSALAGVSVLVALAAARSTAPQRRARALAAIALGLALSLAGSVAASSSRERFRTPLERLPGALTLDAPEGRTVRIEGKFAEDPRVSGARTQATIDVESLEDGGLRAPLGARILATWPAPATAEGLLPLTGRRAEVSLRLRRPRNFGNPGAFDTAGSLAAQGIVATGFAKSARLVSLPPGQANASPRILATRRFEALFERLYPARGGERGALSPEGAVLRASVLGGRVALPPATERALIASGVYHILAVSGLQVAVFGGSLLVLLRRTSLPPRLGLLAATLAVLLYAEIVAPSASVRRAVVAAVAGSASRLALRRTAPLSILTVSAFALLVLYPSNLREPGFQLTFAATAGILVFSDRLRPALPARWGGSPLLAASLAAQAATAPLCAFWFHRLVPYGIASNLLAVPLGSLAVVLGIALLPADLVSGHLSALLGWTAGLAVRALLAVAEVPVEGTVLSFRVAEPAPAVLLASAAALFLLAASRGRGGVRAGIGLLLGSYLLMALSGFVPFPAHPRDLDVPRHLDRDGVTAGGATLTLDLIDVGQGDAILVSFPDGERMLVDGGGFPASSFDVGERVVLPDLLRRGLRRIGRVVLTHAHEDHGGGLREVLRSLRVDEFLSPDNTQGPLRDQLEVMARAQGARVLRIRRAYTIMEGGTEVQCLAPFPGEDEGANGGSLVLRIVHGARSALLTGDIGAATEGRLLSSGLPRCDILKVAHHGSEGATGRRFLEAARPRVAGISDGVGNRFGHPSAEVLARLALEQIWVLRTDRDGAVRMATDGEMLTSGSMRPGHPAPFPGPALRPVLPSECDLLDRERHEGQGEDREAGERETRSKGSDRFVFGLDGRMPPATEKNEDDRPQ